MKKKKRNLLAAMYPPLPYVVWQRVYLLGTQFLTWDYPQPRAQVKMNARVPHLGQRASSHTPISPNTLARVAIVVACSSTTFDQIAVVAFATPAFAYCSSAQR